MVVFMLCPQCANDQTSVVGTYTSHDGDEVKRFRVCPKCEFSFMTFELEKGLFKFEMKRQIKELING
mgnify:CR=1 FL=1